MTYLDGIEYLIDVRNKNGVEVKYAITKLRGKSMLETVKLHLQEGEVLIDKNLVEGI